MLPLTYTAPPLLTDQLASFAPCTRKWQGIPGIERSPTGRLWATWYTGGDGEGPGNYVVLATSTDDGESWQDPVCVIAPPSPARAYDPCLWYDPEGRLWWFWAQTGDGWSDGLAGVWAVVADVSTDDPPCFGPPRRLANGVMMNKPLVLTSGEWLLPIADWTTADQPWPDVPGGRYSHVYTSTDHGATFSLLGSADVPERTFDEHMVVERRDGTLWMLVRTRYGIGQSFSRDRGKTWLPGENSGIRGPNSRFFIRRLASGRLLLINHALPPEDGGEFRRRDRLTAWLSEDDGTSWLGGLLLDERAQVSYPDGVETKDGQITIIYDLNRGDRFAHGEEREILLARFTEDDVLSGRPGPTTRLRQIVSKIPATTDSTWRIHHPKPA